MKKQKQNKYAARCGLSHIGGQVFKQKQKRYDNVTLKAERNSKCQTQ